MNVSRIAEVGITLSIGKFCSGVGKPRCSEKIRNIIGRRVINGSEASL